MVSPQCLSAKPSLAGGLLVNIDWWQNWRTVIKSPMITRRPGLMATIISFNMQHTLILFSSRTLHRSKSNWTPVAGTVAVLNQGNSRKRDSGLQKSARSGQKTGRKGEKRGRWGQKRTMRQNATTRLVIKRLRTATARVWVQWNTMKNYFHFNINRWSFCLPAIPNPFTNIECL